MRFFNIRLIKGLLIVGVVAGFGSEISHRHHCRERHADALARTCVDAALGRETGTDDDEGWGGHRARWVAERCAAIAHERQAGGQSP